MGRRDGLGVRLGVVLVAVATVGAWGALGRGGVAPTVAGATLLFVGGDRYRSLGGLVGSIATGALVLGGVAWLAVTQTGVVSLSATLATGLGLAVGGGLGSVVWLLGLGDPETDTTETVTVDMDSQEDAGPQPEPVDLFEASPDPICFYAEDANGPVVRAVNPAFQRVFGVSSASLDGLPLAEGSLLVDRGEDLVAASREGDTFDEVVACETEDGERRMRVRIAATGRGRADGYVLYVPVEE